MLGADVVVPQPPGLVERELQDLLGPRGKRHLFVGRPLAPADRALDLRADTVRVDVEGLEDLAGHALALADDTEEDMLRTDRAMIEPLRLLLREDDDAAGTFGKPFKHFAGDLPSAGISPSRTGADVCDRYPLVRVLP